MSAAAPIIDRLDALDRALADKRFPYMSRWWRQTFERFYRSGRRQLVLRCGRRGGKSSSLCRIAVLEALYGEHVIPPGDVGIVGIVSVKLDEANQRLRTIKAILDALPGGGVKYKPIDGGIELLHKPIAFKVFAASIAGVVGGTWIAAICDEVSRWRDADTGANPAKEVLASLRPTMATQPNAKLFLSSSPLGSQDAHALAFELGETEFQCVAFAPTWEANPTVSEAETHALEPDERVWKREYAAIPQAGALGAFEAADIDRAFLPRAPGAVHGPRIVVIDASSGAKDSYTWCAVSWARPADPKQEPYICFESLDGIQGSFFRQVTGAQVVARVAAFARTKRAIAVHGDQRDAFMVKSEFARHGISFGQHDYTATSKPRAVECARRWFRESAIAFPPHEQLRKELHSFEERIAPSGSFTFGARGSGHDDFVALILTAALANERGHLPPPPKHALAERPTRPVATFTYDEPFWGTNQQQPAASSAELVASLPHDFFGRRQ